MTLINTKIIAENKETLNQLRRIAAGTTSGAIPKKFCDNRCARCWCHYIGVPCDREYKENEFLSFRSLNAAFGRIQERKERVYRAYEVSIDTEANTVDIESAG